VRISCRNPLTFAMGFRFATRVVARFSARAADPWTARSRSRPLPTSVTMID